MSEEVDARDQKSNNELEKYRIRYGLYKIIFGTAIVGILSVVVPGAVEFWRVTFENQRLAAQSQAEEKRRELEMELDQITQQQSYVKDFLDTALNQDIELRIRFADYFSKVSAEPFREDWKEYRDALVETRNLARTEINLKEESLLRGISVSSPTIEQQIENARLSRELEWRYREIGYVARNRSIVPSESEAEDAQRSLAAIGPGSLVRIVMHWTAGPHRADPINRRTYHEIVEGDGTRVHGDNPPEANAIGASGRYAPHTLNANRGSIGLAMAAMLNVRERPFDAGPYPITIVQLEAFCELVAEYARVYEIPITRETVLTHAEVQTTLGIAQRNKFDITWLPGMAQPGNPIEVGDRLREMIRGASDGRCSFQAEAEPANDDE